MRFVIVTGLSGAGKTTALKVMEDIGFFCVDNLPSVLLSKFADLCFQGNTEFTKVAVGIDIRGREFFHALVQALDYMTENNYQYEILFMYADEGTLVNRYNFTRRVHPLASGGRIIEGIRKENEMLADLKVRATFLLDTSKMHTKKTSEILHRTYGDDGALDKVSVNLLSFGYKRGMPLDADYVLDVRFLPNPYNVQALRTKCGKDEEVQEYVFSSAESKEMMEKIHEMVRFIAPHYAQSGKREMLVAIGCTGGMHRSVAFVEVLAQLLLQDGIEVNIDHRDLETEKVGVRYTPVE